jgi:molecular chaperone HscA
MLASESDEVLLLDVLPLSLGVETMGGAVSKVLPRNTTIPAGAKSTFTTYADGQTGFELHVVQGERELAKDCRSLARFLLRGIPPMPAGQARLEVEFRVDENNLLRVEARELTTGIQQAVDVQPSYGLTDEQVEDMLIDALDHGEQDFDEGRRVEAVVEAERMLLATQKAFTSDGDLLTQADKAVVVAALATLREGIDAGASASVLQLRISDLDRATQAWAGQRMNRAIAGALAGMQLTQVAEQVESARGVEAHLREHAGLPSELTTAAEGDK